MTNKIIISGSMSNYDLMVYYKKILNQNGINCVIPDRDKITQDKSKLLENKKEASLEYFNEIVDKDVYGVLVLNETKKNINNYIGANTFAEIVIAFYHNKQVFLLNDIYDMYRDELEAWNVVPLKGDIDILINKINLEKRN